MLEAVVAWLDRVGSAAFAWSVAIFVLLNGFGVAMIAIRRDRALVNRWTSRFLAANLLLLGTGVGVPLLTVGARAAIMALAPALRSLEAPGTRDAGVEPGPVDAVPR